MTSAPTAIAYDQKVVNFIAGLDATGHVTHRSYKKTSVTLHHNAGRLSLQGILDVWKVRPASAHFQCDRLGAIGQYVRVNEYAWAVGNTLGNQTSISIEMANATLSPTWQVAEVTWKSAARLAAWLHWKVIGFRPTKTSLKFHHDWSGSGTACAGPYMDSIRAKVLAECQRQYDIFVKASRDNTRPPVTTSIPQLAITGKLDKATITAWQRVMKTTRDGFLSEDSMLIRAVQRLLGLVVDGHFSPKTTKAVQKRIGVNQDGDFGPISCRALQRRLNTGKF